MSFAKNKQKEPDAGNASRGELARSLIGRQPILDREGRVQAYELLFRSDTPVKAEDFDGNRATANVIVNALTEFDLNEVIGTRKAFINFTDDLLQSETVRLLPKERVVIEVLEDVKITKQLVQSIAALAKDGYHIALDDFVFEPAWEPLILLARTIKLDVMALSRHQVEEHVKRLRRYDVELLAEKVEDAEEHTWLMDLGFDLFQGYFYAKPSIVARAQIPQNHLAVVRLLAALNNKSAKIEEIERLVSEDVSLSYRLLRYINSAFVSLPQKVDSIRRSVIYFGLDMLRQWASLLVMASVDGKPKVLMETALVRAYMCEGLAKEQGLPDYESFFTVGLFSILDSLLDTPMETIIEPLPLSNDIVRALVAREGDLGAALECACAYESCKRDGVAFFELDRAVIGEIYLDAIQSASEAASAL